MSRLLRFFALVVLVAGIVAGTGVSASAAQAPSATGAVAAASETPSDQPVTGETWSSPAAAVACKQTAETVLCTPTNPDDTVQQACYAAVPTGTSGFVTVCSTAGANQTDLDTRGEKLDFQWGCQFGDVFCSTMEGSAEQAAAESLNMAARGAAALRFNTDSLLWTVALDQWSFWAWAVLIVVLVGGIVGITMAAYSGSTSEVIWAVVRMGITFPLIQLTLWMLGQIVNAVDLLSFSIYADADLFGTMGELLFNAGGKVNPMAGFIVVALLFITNLVLFIVLMVRNIGLALLVMVGPIAWMIFPLPRVGKEWIVRYLSAVVALLLAGPIMMSAFKFVTDGLRSVSSVWDPAVWPFMLTLLGLCFAPLAVFSLFSFAGGSVVDAAAGAAGRGASSAATKVTRAIPRPRVGQPPAGRPGMTPRSANTTGPSPSASTGRTASPSVGRPTQPAGASPGRSTNPAPAGSTAPSSSASPAPSTRASRRQSEAGGATPPRPNGGTQ